jgi:hypothetical protein
VENRTTETTEDEMNIEQLVAESNRIEGITRPPTREELDEFKRFMMIETMSIAELCRFVKVYQPNAVLRDRDGLNVLVGMDAPPPGGQRIIYMLDELLHCVNKGELDAWHAHVEYERIHPFTDGNGRSGRALWYWMHLGNSRPTQYGFLHWFYYETLRNCKGKV